MIAKDYEVGNSIVINATSLDLYYRSLAMGLDDAVVSVALAAIVAGIRMTCLPGGVTPL